MDIMLQYSMKRSNEKIPESFVYDEKLILYDKKLIHDDNNEPMVETIFAFSSLFRYTLLFYENLV